ncbi:MAG: hypothetical protein II952_06555, partial [Paludibacteraceae bacterium]|nr:hypothetical protein [Paludibacteraceae bacterium]
CEKQQEREPSPVFEGTSSVFFPVSSESEELEPTVALEHEIKISRDTLNSEAITVKLIVTNNDENIFEVPESVSFAAGVKETSFVVKFPNAQVDGTYNLAIELEPLQSNPYMTLKPTYSYTVNIAKWDAVTDKKAIIFDGIINAWYVVGNPGWYVNYSRKDNADGSFDIRLLNPYTVLPEYKDGDYDSPIADEFGLYGGFPYNYPTDVVEGTFNMTIHVARNGSATFDGFDLGMDWGNGMFYARYYDPTIPGVWNSAEKSITFPAGSSASFRGESGRLNSEPIVVFLDDAIWKDINSSISIASLEDGFNDASIEWTTIESKLNTIVSTIQPGLIETQLESAVDPNPEDKQGEGSDFFNLFRLKDVYTPGLGLAFYFDEEKGKISLPASLQPTGLSFAGKDIFVGPAANDCYIEELELQGKPAKLFHFFLQVQTKDGGNLGEFEEIFYFSTEEIVWGEKAEDFVGTYKLTASSQFSGEADADMDVAIEQKDDKLILLGVDLSDTIWVDFDNETKKISIAPQALGDYGPYDITLYTTTVEGDISTTEPIVLSMAFGGIIKVDAASGADGYLLRSEAVGGWVDGYYDLTFTPAASAAAPAIKSAPVKNKGQVSLHARKAVKSQQNWKINGKVNRHELLFKK